MNILLWVFFGGIAGWLASLLVGADASMGMAANVAVGIAGAVVGGWLSQMASFETEPDFGTVERPTEFVSFAWAVIGSAVLLFALNLLA